MQEKLIVDYLKDTGKKMYTDNDVILYLQTAGEWIIFTERSHDGVYFEQHMIPLLDIVAWAYSKTLSS